MEQGSIPNLHRGIDGDSQISQNRTGYDEIECNRDKQKTGGTGYLLLTVKANPTLSFRIIEMFISFVKLFLYIRILLIHLNI